MTAPARPSAAVENTSGLPLYLSAKITLPGTPDIRLSPNRNTPPRTAKRLRASLRDAAILALRSWRNDIGEFGDAPMFSGPTRIRVTVLWEPGRRTWDPDNLTAALKYLDCLERTGIIDNDRNLIWEPVRQTKDPDGRGVVIVELGAFE